MRNKDYQIQNIKNRVITGVVYDIRQSYNDVFFVVGAVYAVNTIVFAAICIIQRRRNVMTTAS